MQKINQTLLTILFIIIIMGFGTKNAISVEISKNATIHGILYSYQIAISPEGKYILVGDEYQSTVTFAKSDGTILWHYTLPEGVKMESGAIASDGDIVLIGGQGEVSIFALSKEGALLWTDQQYLSSQIAVTDDGNKIFKATSSLESPSLVCYDSKGNLLWNKGINARDWQIWDIDITADGNRILLKTNSDIILCDGNGNEITFFDIIEGNSLVDGRLSADGSQFAASYHDKDSDTYHIGLYDIATRQELWKKNIDYYGDVCFDEHGNLFATVRGYENHIWDNQGNLLTSWPSGGSHIDVDNSGTTCVVGEFAEATVYKIKNMEKVDDVIVLLETMPDTTITSGNTSLIYGTSGENNITVESGAGATLVNFKGSNTISIHSDADLFTVSRSGATVTFEGTDGTFLKIPATVSSQSISFSDVNLDLVIKNNQVTLGGKNVDDIIFETESPIAGIVDLFINKDNNQISGFPGELIEAQINILSDSVNNSFVYEIENGPDGTTVSNEGIIEYQISNNSETNIDLPFEVKITNTLSKENLILEGSIYVMEAKEIGLGIVTSEGGIISDQWENIVVEIPTGAVSEDVEVKIIQGQDVSGRDHINFLINGVIDCAFDIYLPDPNLFDSNNAIDGLRISKKTFKTFLFDSDDYPLKYNWSTSNNKKYFSEKKDCRLPNGTKKVSLTQDQLNEIGELIIDDAYRLMSAEPKPEKTEILKGEPVVFIHGYHSQDSFGGGYKTWGNFPLKIRTMDNGDISYIPFEFQWRTNARFQDVADDLGISLTEIAARTNKKIHIVAHSFGGILIRTLLQKLNNDGNDYSSYIASLTTLGTPHSGIFDEYEEEDKGLHPGVAFPKGQDSWVFEVTGQISVHQMGEKVNFVSKLNKIFNVDKKEGKLAADLANTDDNSIPAGIPIQVGIGLTTWEGDNPYVIDNGDRLISYEGQRFHPNLTKNGTFQTLLNNNTDYGGRITEFVLGFNEDVHPGHLNAEKIVGYKHFGFGAKDSTPSEAKVRCPNNDSCDHPSYKAVKKWLSDYPAEDIGTPFINFKVTVVDNENDHNLSGARIYVLDDNRCFFNTGDEITSSDGIANVRVAFLPNTKYYVRVELEGYHTYTFDNEFVTAGTIKQTTSNDFGRINLVKTPGPGNLEGTIVDAISGSNISDVYYELFNGVRLITSGFTNNNGFYLISDILCGSYILKFVKEGYLDTSFSINIEPGSTKIANGTMRRKIATNSLGMTFVGIKPGTFMMGSPVKEWGRDPDETQHQVTLSQTYYMQTTEVTQGQWKEVMGSNPSHFSDCGDICPLENISWEDAQEFIIEMNKRREGTYTLPTEAQWEYAARAGSTTAFANGDIKETDLHPDDPNLDVMGWYLINSYGETHPVAQKQANAWGLYDMHGNVREWCQDWYGAYSSDAVTDPEGSSSGSYRVGRGGNWGELARYCRSAIRLSYSPDGRDGGIGLRLVLSPAPPSTHFNVEKHYIASGPYSGCENPAPEPQDVFALGHYYVLAYNYVHNMTKNDETYMDWKAPDGTSERIYNPISVDGDACMYNGIIPNISGNWSVDFYWNDEFQYTDSFEVLDSGNMRIEKHYIASAPYSGCENPPAEQKNIFKFGEGVVAYNYISNMKEGDINYMIWYAPDGSNFRIDNSPVSFNGSGCCYTGGDPNNTKIEGAWSVEFYYNDVKQYTDTFTVSDINNELIGSWARECEGFEVIETFSSDGIWTYSDEIGGYHEASYSWNGTTLTAELNSTNNIGCSADSSYIGKLFELPAYINNGILYITFPDGCTESYTSVLAGDRITNSLGMNFVKIQPGTFMMGSPEDEHGRFIHENQRQITLTQTYYIQTTEVTQGQWEEVMGNNPSFFSNCGADCPVEMVSWNDSQEFITQMNLRGEGNYSLPTEAQWEYAARANSTTAFANGDIIDYYTIPCGHDSNLDIMGWYCYNSDSMTHPVAQKQANGWGLYDIHGNVGEWCQDYWYESYSSDDIIDPEGPSSGSTRVFRSGEWFSPARMCRSACRIPSLSESNGPHKGIGLRLILFPVQP